MAFVGFKSAADATSALSYFNNSFIDTFRIAVGGKSGRQAGRGTDRQAGRQGDRQAGRGTGRRAGGQKKRKSPSAARLASSPLHELDLGDSGATPKGSHIHVPGLTKKDK